MANVVDDVFAFLQAEAAAGGNSGWALVRRRLQDKPDRCVVIAEDGGDTGEISAAEGIGDAALAAPGVLVTVRAAAWDGDASAAKAAAVRDLLHGRRGLSLVNGGMVYLGVRAMTPEPIFAGFDETGRPTHTIAFRLLRAV